MRLLCLDYRNGYEPAAFTSFGGDQSCFDFDVVIWDPKFALYEYGLAYPVYTRGSRPWTNQVQPGVALTSTDAAQSSAICGVRRRTVRNHSRSPALLL